MVGGCADLGGEPATKGLPDRSHREGSRRRDLSRERARPGPHVVARNEVVAETDPERLFAIHPATRVEHLHPALAAYQAGEGHGQTEALDEA